MKTDTLGEVAFGGSGNKTIDSLQRFHIEFTTFDYESEINQTVWQCIVSATSKKSATNFAEKHRKAVAELTNCLSMDELNNVGADDCIDFIVTPLDDFVKNLEEGVDVLEDTIKQMEDIS